MPDTGSSLDDGDAPGADAGAVDTERAGTDSGVTHLSIGEVLAVLSEEFPDVTISKIRFLESQGLVQPERNASGYRQFGDADIERLRWILRQQRDHFLPLKVIRRALERGVDVIDAGAGDQPTLWTAVAEAAAREEVGNEKERIARGEAEDARRSAARSMTHPSTRRKRSGSGAVREGSDGARRSRHSSPADVVAALQEDPRPPATEPPAGQPDDVGSAGAAPSGAADVPEPVLPTTDPAAGAEAAAAAPMASGGNMRQLSREELLTETALAEDLLDELIEFGLVDPVEVAGELVYDQVDLAVAAVAGRSAELGISARHLRMYKVAADREAGLLEQVAMPLLKQRNPAAKAKAAETVSDLASMGAELHRLLLARELGPHLAP